MPITVRDAGSVNRSITRVRVLDGEAMRLIRAINVMDASGTLRTIYTASDGGTMTAGVSPSTAFGSVSTPATVIVTSGNVTATPTGGTGPYSYSWAMTSTTGDAVTATAPTSATTAFQSSPLGPGDSVDAVFTVTVTDAFGLTGTATASVSLNNFDFGGL